MVVLSKIKSHSKAVSYLARILVKSYCSKNSPFIINPSKNQKLNV